MNAQTIPTAEPFFLPGNRTGVLLIHGFTGAPKEMRWMGEYLNAQGYSCLGVRLTGHATRPKDMIRSRWTDWTASVEDGYNILRGAADRIFLAGLSMGGALSLLMSTRLEARGVVSMSAPYDLPDPHPAWQIWLASYFMTYQKKTKEEPGAGWFDKEASKDHVSYPLNPVRSGAELAVLLAKMRAALPKIKTPVCLIHSRNDAYVPPENMERIYAALTVTDKSKFYVEKSGHVVTRDAERGRVFEIARDFIRRLEL
ncbi:MAG: alpha/beta fold hydrolase [Chloroflexi bacterium]|nr:alpha/beta fold hydrolase [Chloroflexota bacterium]MCA2002058.1 alpha/beta fold hydrolase [Chloroflexota bacterium]